MESPKVEGFVVFRDTGADVWIGRSTWALTEPGYRDPIEIRGRTQEELLAAREHRYRHELAELRALLSDSAWRNAGIGP